VSDGEALDSWAVTTDLEGELVPRQPDALHTITSAINTTRFLLKVRHASASLSSLHPLCLPRPLPRPASLPLPPSPTPSLSLSLSLPLPLPPSLPLPLPLPASLARSDVRRPPPPSQIAPAKSAKDKSPATQVIICA
jgi:hypothetical protein